MSLASPVSEKIFAVDGSHPTRLVQIGLVVLFGVVATLLTYKGYGYSDQVEQLPIIFRAIDKDYLKGDFFTNSSFESPARVYYAQMLAFIAGNESHLPLVMLIITMTCNIIVALATYSAACTIFRKRSLTGLVAAGLAMSFATLHYGYANAVWVEFLRPFSIAQALSFAAFALMLRANLALASLCLAGAILIHPLFGLESAALILGVYVACGVFLGPDPPRKVILRACRAAAILAVPAGLVFAMEAGQSRIKSTDFIEILAYIRHPHIYLPSSFRLHDHVYAVAFLASLFALQAVSAMPKGEWQSVAVRLTAWLLVALAILGVIFTEVFPVRLFVVMQPLRLLMFVKWLLLILLAGALTAPRAREVWLARAAYVISSLNPLTLALVSWLDLIGSARGNPWSIPRRILAPSLAVLAVIIVLIWLPPRNVALYCAIGGMVGIAAYAGARVAAVAAVIVFGIASAVLLSEEQRSKGVFSGVLQEDLGPAGRPVAEYSLLNLPEDAVVVVPQNWGSFRLVARRAIVVDFKAFPFADRAMQEWRNRIEDCYGLGPASNYHEIDDVRLKQIAHKYGAQFAVLYVSTTTSFPILYENAQYKLVRL